VIAAAWEACASWTQLQSAVTVVATAGTEPVVWPAPSGCGGGVVDPVAEELAAALRLSPASTGNRIAAARRLAAVPAITSLVADGLLAAGPARWIADDLALFPADDVATVTANVAARVRARARSGLRGWTGSEVRQQCARSLLRLGSAKVAKARKEARRGRRVTVTGESNGMAWLNAYLSAVDATRIYARLTAIAKGIDDPDRGMDAKRCDLVIDALLTTGPDTAGIASDSDEAPRDPDTRTTHARPQAGSDDETGAGADVGPGTGAGAGVTAPATPDAAVAAGSPSGSRPATARRQRPTGGLRSRRIPAEVCVVVKLTTLLGLDEDPADLPGVGPIPAEEARELAADGSWRAWITDAATGRVIDTGRRTYTPSAGLARLIRAREPYCRMTGCRRRAINCDLDHTIPFPTGWTTESNIGPLCRRHHRLKTHHRFRLHNDPTGPATGGPETDTAGPDTVSPAWTWTMPSGLTYRDTPDPPLDP
jgi:hypothetical protein